MTATYLVVLYATCMSTLSSSSAKRKQTATFAAERSLADEVWRPAPRSQSAARDGAATMRAARGRTDMPHTPQAETQVVINDPIVKSSAALGASSSSTTTAGGSSSGGSSSGDGRPPPKLGRQGTFSLFSSMPRQPVGDPGSSESGAPSSYRPKGPLKPSVVADSQHARCEDRPVIHKRVIAAAADLFKQCDSTCSGTLQRSEFATAVQLSAPLTTSDTHWWRPPGSTLMPPCILPPSASPRRVCAVPPVSSDAREARPLPDRLLGFGPH